ncbi:RNA-guided endonuclease TnpB family protein [Micromonospora sp. DR5-3]|uniref:RNA-guided endonuclease TnpB family protein n=1 Tax=unclassified Micromonospora TaxID=2617518 RepID=UPI0011D5FDBE|nr:MULTISPECIES: RNA-guided endonuclease TnpB family protein [unclassified Micromonospora]MCW3820549.1 RNA-guided endonuclease TnpB family protein [Micromonospora sp. DR5-3]TYC20415.1 transposase [Micromonospora sp. MP36]
MKVTRIAYSARLNPGKYAALVEQARRLGRVRSEVWQRYGSILGVGSGLRDRQVRDRWLADGTHARFGVLANAWKETVRDAMADIGANLEAAKVDVRRAISRRTNDPAERKRMYTALKADRWAGDPFLARQMRKHWKRGRNRTHDQIVVRADKYNIAVDGRGRLWLAIPGLEPRKLVKIPLSTTVAPTGTLRLILRGGRVEVHYQIDASQMRSSRRPCGDQRVGVDKGYTEALTDSDGQSHGEQLGDLLTRESDRLKERNRRRAKLRSIANTATARGDHAKAHRIKTNNLGTAKRDRQAARHRARVRTEIFTAVHEVVDKAATVIAEDLTKRFTGHRKLPKNMNRRLAAWTKGVTAEALKSVSERRGSAHVPVNAAYTSQTCHHCGAFGRRSGDRFHCTRCGVVWQADVNAAINILQRAGDPDIALHTPHQRVKQILQDRTDRHRTRLPVQDSSPATAGRRAKHPNHSAMSNE